MQLTSCHILRQRIELIAQEQSIQLPRSAIQELALRIKLNKRDGYITDSLIVATLANYLIA